jgi:hypothetical protein
MAKTDTIKISKKLFLALGVFLVVIGLIVTNLLSNYFFFLRRAHSSFENYYAFRGCKELLQKTDSYGICRTDGGNTIKIVLYNGRWYLDGDLPVCYFNICL